jgi:hypothetical protein
VKRATEALVKEAQKYKNGNGDDVDLNVSDKLVGGLAQVCSLSHLYLDVHFMTGCPSIPDNHGTRRHPGEGT